MAYKSKFLHFKTKASYEAERAKTTAGTEERKVFDAYISFIDEGPMICTWGKEYKCDISASEVEALVDAGKISPATVAPLIAGATAVGTSLKYAREDHRHPAQTTVSGNAGTATKWATARKITVTGGSIGGEVTLDGSANVSFPLTIYDNSHRHNNTTIDSLDASKITSGTINADRLPNIPIEKLPAGALERMFVMESQNAAINAVKASTIQEGDVVQIGSKGLMYFCIDGAATTFGNAFKEFTAGSATSVPWSGVTNAPTKLSQFTNDSGFTTNKGTVTSVAMSVPTGLSISGSPITASGTLALSYTSGFSIPSTAKQTNWDTAYEWGDHASAGYVKNSVNENITGIKNFMNGLKVFTNSATTSNEYNTTGKINTTNYAAPIIFGSNSGKVWWSTQFQSSTTLLIGRANSIPIRIQSLNSSEGNASEIYATRFYQNEKLVATEEWVTGKGYLTSVPAQTWGSITGKPTFATVATSGSYNDLTNKPTIPSLSGYATQNWVTSQGYLTSIPTATSSTYGGIQIGYTTSGKNYAVQLSNGKAYVNVPWTDTDTTYSAGTNISISGTTINCTYSYTLPTATSSVLGGVKVGSNITLSSGTISLSKSNVTSALGYTPANTSDIPEIPIALPNPYALTINGQTYTGSSAVSVTTSKPLTSGGNTGGTVVAGRNYSATSSSISSVSGFSYNNPDAVVGSSTKITSFPSSVRKMDGIADLSGSYYVYCFSYIGGYVYVNGAVYA